MAQPFSCLSRHFSRGFKEWYHFGNPLTWFKRYDDFFDFLCLLMVKYLENSGQSRIFYIFCQLHIEVVKVFFFNWIEKILTVQKWPKKCLIDKFRGKCERYWPKNPFKKTVSGAIFSPTPLVDATYKKNS